MVYEIESNDLAASATVVSAGGTATGSLSSGNDRDWFAFDLAGPGVLHFGFDETPLGSASYAYIVQVRNAAGEIIAGYRTSHDLDVDIGIAGAGRYYAVVSSLDPTVNTNSYSIALNYEATVGRNEVELNDTRATAQVLAPGAVISANTGYLVGFDSFRIDNDWYRIDLADGQTLSAALQPFAPGYQIFTVELWDGAGNLIESHWGQERSEFLVRDLDAGSYYFRVYGTESEYLGAYQLSVNAFAPIQGASGSEAEPNDSKATANTIEKGTQVSGTLSSLSDQDWYQIDLSADARIVLSSGTVGGQTNALYVVEVRDTSGNIVQQFNTRSNLDTDVGIAEAGTYYLVVRSGGTLDAGGYNLAVIDARNPGHVEIESNDTRVTANAFSGQVSGVLDTAADVDWFRIVVSDTGLYTFTLASAYFGYADGTQDFTLELTDASGNSFGIHQGGYGDFEVGRLQAGTYYATLSTYGDYNLFNAYSLSYGVAASTENIVNGASSAAPQDPGFADAWYLQAGGAGLNVRSVWADYTGLGVQAYVLGAGIDYRVPDLSDAFSATLSFDSTTARTWVPGAGAGNVDQSTTAAMLLAADRDGVAGIGAAYGAEVGTLYVAPVGGTDTTRLIQNGANALGYADQADIVLDLWTPYFGVPSQFTATAYDEAVADLASTGRSGLGTILVSGAGDNPFSIGDTNRDYRTSDHHRIVVSAVDVSGTVSPTSYFGNSILVSAPGGTSADPIGSAHGGVYASPTTAAAALISGVVALMLEANPDLGWRDVQQILSLSGRQTDPSSDSWEFNRAAGWNGGGMHYSWNYGFGLVDARAAVRLAESWDQQSTSANEQVVQATSSASIAIPDNSLAGASSSVTLGNLDIEWIEVEISMSHTYFEDLVFTLTGPSGTVSVPLAFVPNNNGQSGAYSFRFDVADFRGENAAGTWALGIYDLIPEDQGALSSWTIRAYGSAASSDDSYIYTDEYGTLSDADASRRSLSDTNGGHDVVNIAALSAAARIDLAGGASQIAGRSLSIAGGVIEDAYGGDGGDTLIGNDLANLLQGARGDDALFGGDGDDTLLGGAGNDWLDGGAGANEIDGGDGFDYVSFRSVAGAVTIRQLGGGLSEAVFADMTVQQMRNVEAFDAAGGIVTDGSSGDDQFTGGEGGDILRLGAGNDYLAGAGGDDVLEGGDGQDWLWAGSGNDTLDGGAEKDNLNGEAGDDVIDGGAGNDRITGRDGNDVIHAGTGNDWVGVWNDWGEQPELNYFPEWGDDQIFGDEGNDVLSAGFGRDTVHGGTGDDYVAGEQDDDLLYGDEGYDWLWAGAGNDTLDGGTEKDNLNGESGNDLIHGGDGNDRICGQQDDDEIHAGAGNDWVGVWNDWGEDPALNYFPESGNDLIFGDEGNDVLSAGFGRDTVHGGADDDYVAGEQEDDVLYGDAGTDWLWGGAGEDALDGGDGNDVLIGEAGIDTLTGGAGADRFTWYDLSEIGDLVTDFDGASGDRLDVSELLFRAGYGGTDPFADLRLSLDTAGADVLFRFDGSLIATLENNTLAQLQTSYFIV